ncbi:hypothetical protein [Streptomyces spiramenti]|uniref:hypothetical protein n=1 Tax=Streptomyces spiramenti TaxID=2720606 RepID=UPI001FD78091|nr:hypothetical protein [Streptomyces spiramenti]
MGTPTRTPRRTRLPRLLTHEHYTSPERLHHHFTGDWEILLTLRTTEFTEHAHVGQLHDHTHRMGMLLAARTSTLTYHC